MKLDFDAPVFIGKNLVAAATDDNCGLAALNNRLGCFSWRTKTRLSFTKSNASKIIRVWLLDYIAVT